MPSNRADGLETRSRLLEAAIEAFASKGYQDTRTADICRASTANGAAINYHFGGKEGLYVAAWRHAFDRSLATYPPGGETLPGAPVEERFRARILSLARRMTDPMSRDLDMADLEMSRPTGLLGPVIREAVDPLRRLHRDIIGELLGPNAQARDVELCAMSTHAQSFMVFMQERRRKRAMATSPVPFMGPPPLPCGVEELVDHVTRFSLAGIEKVRAEAATRAGMKETGEDRP